MLNLVIAVTFNSLLALGAYYKKSLTLDGAVTAVIVGSSIWLLGGFQGFCLMGIFFVSSSLLSKFKTGEREALGLDKLHDKSDVRDYTQVLANSLAPLIFLIIMKISGSTFWYLGFVCAFCAANADTWASEIGVLSKTKPKYLIKGTEVKPGLSGGVTILGLIASFLGSSLIAFSYLGMNILAGFSNYFSPLSLLKGVGQQNSMLLIMASALLIIGGFLGSLLDSLMGELLQVKYQSKNPLVGITERAVDQNLNNIAEKNIKLKGISWMDNNAVNFISVLMASSIISIIYGWLN